VPALSVQAEKEQKRKAKEKERKKAARIAKQQREQREQQEQEQLQEKQRQQAQQEAGRAQGRDCESLSFLSSHSGQHSLPLPRIHCAVISSNTRLGMYRDSTVQYSPISTVQYCTVNRCTVLLLRRASVPLAGGRCPSSCCALCHYVTMSLCHCVIVQEAKARERELRAAAAERRLGSNRFKYNSCGVPGLRRPASGTSSGMYPSCIHATGPWPIWCPSIGSHISTVAPRACVHIRRCLKAHEVAPLVQQPCMMMQASADRASSRHLLAHAPRYSTQGVKLSQDIELS